MAKKEETGQFVDFDNLNDEQTEKVKNAVKQIAEYKDLIKGHQESIKFAVEDLAVGLDADKDSTKKLKKFLRDVVKAYITRSAETLREEHGTVERILEKLGELPPA